MCSIADPAPHAHVGVFVHIIGHLHPHPYTTAHTTQWHDHAAQLGVGLFCFVSFNSYYRCVHPHPYGTTTCTHTHACTPLKTWLDKVGTPVAAMTTVMS